MGKTLYLLALQTKDEVPNEKNFPPWGFLASFPVHFCPRSFAAPLNNNLAYASKQASRLSRQEAQLFRVVISGNKEEGASGRAAGKCDFGRLLASLLAGITLGY